MVQVKAAIKPKKQKGILQLRKEAWVWFSRLVRAEEGYICFTCGKNLNDNKSAAHAGHYVPQSKGNALRFDRRNVHCQCNTCNTFKAGNLYEYAVRLQKKYGMGILQELDAIKNQTKKFTREELTGMIAEYKERLARLAEESA